MDKRIWLQSTCIAAALVGDKKIKGGGTDSYFNNGFSNVTIYEDVIDFMAIYQCRQWVISELNGNKHRSEEYKLL